MPWVEMADVVYKVRLEDVDALVVVEARFGAGEYIGEFWGQLLHTFDGVDVIALFEWRESPPLFLLIAVGETDK
jgi:hypothetical protein